MHRLFLLSSFCFLNVSAAKLPSFMKACSSSDPNLDQCIANVIRTGGSIFAKGIPDLGISSMDPLQLDRIAMNNPSFNLTLSEVVLTGLGDFHLISVHVNADRNKLNFNFTANVTLKSHYVMDGQVLIMPIKGDGDIKLKIKNLNVAIKFDIKMVNNFWTIPTYKKTYRIEHASVKFTNLFNGNKELADVTHKFANENWNELIHEIASPAIHQVIEHCVDNVKILLSVVPASELLLE